MGAQSRENNQTPLVSSCLSVRPSAQKTPSPVQLIFVKNFFWEALLKSVNKIQVLLKSDEIIGRLYGDLNIFTINPVAKASMADIHSKCER